MNTTDLGAGLCGNLSRTGPEAVRLHLSHQQHHAVVADDIEVSIAEGGLHGLHVDRDLGFDRLVFYDSTRGSDARIFLHSVLVRGGYQDGGAAGAYEQECSSNK